MAAYMLSGGAHGGTLVDFPTDTIGAIVDMPSERPGRVERYELRAQLDANGDELEGERFGQFIGTVKV